MLPDYVYLRNTSTQNLFALSSGRDYRLPVMQTKSSVKEQGNTPVRDSLTAQLREPLDSLNSNYGRGSVGAIRLCLDGEGVFEQKPFGLRSTQRRFHIVSSVRGVTVFALGHQITLKGVL